MHGPRPLLALLVPLLLVGCGGKQAAYRQPPVEPALVESPQDDRGMYLALIRQMQDQGAYYASLAHVDAFKKRFGDTPDLRILEADAQREKFWVHESDHLTYLQVYSAWKSNGYSDGWCIKHFLHPKSLRRAKEIREQLLDIVKMQKMQMISCGMDWDVIRKCICSGYYHQAAKYKGSGEYINLRTSLGVQLHPTSALYAGHPPDYVVYHELVLTSKVYVSTVTAVDPHWLADLGGVFYSVKEKGYSARHKRITETEFNRKMEIESKMAEDKRRDEEKKEVEAERATKKKKVGSDGKKFVTQGAVRKPVIKRRGRGF